jgi:hypothetical protein
MTRQRYAAQKAKLVDINRTLREGHLTAEQRSQLEALSIALTSELLTPWLPVTYQSWVIMCVLIAAGLYGLLEGPLLLIAAWPVALLLSPRVAGGSLYPGGRTSRHPSP